MTGDEFCRRATPDDLEWIGEVTGQMRSIRFGLVLKRLEREDRVAAKRARKSRNACAIASGTGWSVYRADSETPFGPNPNPDCVLDDHEYERRASVAAKRLGVRPSHYYWPDVVSALKSLDHTLTRNRMGWLVGPRREEVTQAEWGGESVWERQVSAIGPVNEPATTESDELGLSLELSWGYETRVGRMDDPVEYGDFVKAYFWILASGGIPKWDPYRQRPLSHPASDQPP